MEFLTSLTNCSRLQHLSIAWNRSTGKLPNSLANMSSNLQQLRMFGNGMVGDIPLGIGNLVGLEMIDIGQNLLSGVIPESMGALTKLNWLFLFPRLQQPIRAYPILHWEPHKPNRAQCRFQQPRRAYSIKHWEFGGAVSPSSDC